MGLKIKEYNRKERWKKDVYRCKTLTSKTSNLRLDPTSLRADSHQFAYFLPGTLFGGARGVRLSHGAIPHTHGYIGLLRRHNSKNNFSFLVER